MIALPLLKKEGFGALILENPYYGSRKPPGQTLSQVQYVSDLFVMGLTLMLECLVLRRWLKEEELGPVGITGASMGGHVRINWDGKRNEDWFTICCEVKIHVASSIRFLSASISIVTYFVNQLIVNLSSLLW